MIDRVPWFDDEDFDFWRGYPDGVTRVDHSFKSYSLINEYPMEDSVLSEEDYETYY